MSVIILDLDNCISDDAWRVKHIDWSAPVSTRYTNYHSLAGMDRLANNPELLCKGHDIVVSTSRPDTVRMQTTGWLLRNGLRPWIIMMRPVGNQEPSVDLKRSNLLALRDGYNVKFGDILMAYDDHAEIVEMYKEHGVPAQVLRVHDTKMYKEQV